MSLSNPPENPIDLFNKWFDEAMQRELSDPNAMSVATVNSEGKPSVRIVLLKGVADNEFVFYTNLESRKGEELSKNQNVALCFHWKTTHKQVRVEGAVKLVTPEEADAYFATRPVGSQIGAWASKQSKPMKGREELEQSLAEYALKFGDDPVPRPPHWSGFRVDPTMIEFWQEQPFRLHNRLLYTKDNDGWHSQHLYP